MRKIVLFLSPFLFPLFVSSQVNISDAFQNTVKKISRDRVKDEVIEWITENDPVTGIVARDLIAQVIDNHKDEKALLKSTANVMSTMLFIGGIKKHIEPMIKKYPAILEQAENEDWDRNTLTAYSALYIYYSERIKRHLYVSRSVMEMKEEKKQIESFVVYDSAKQYDLKWTSIISREFVLSRGTGENLNLAMDVRALEFVQYCLAEILTHEQGAAARIDTALQSLKASYENDGEKKFSHAIEKLQQTGDALHVLQELFTRYLNQYKETKRGGDLFVLAKNHRALQAMSEESDSLASLLNLNNALADPFISVISSARYSYVDPAQSRQIIVGITKQLIDTWIAKAHQNGWKFEYTFSLAGTVFLGGSKTQMDFTVLDQFRFACHWNSTTLFLFAGGIFDPILKNTIYNAPVQLYLAGAGYQWGDVSLSLNVGIPYADFKSSNFRYGVSAGYEIPLSDILE